MSTATAPREVVAGTGAASRRPPRASRRWPWAAIAVVVILAAGFKPVVENDGIYYFAYLQAIFVDHTLNVARELPNGYQSSADWFPVGSALLSVPAYLLALLVGGGGRPAFDGLYTAAFVAASLAYGLLALAICQRLALRLIGSTRPAAAGVAAAALTTPFLYYLLYEPSYSHTFSAFTASCFVYLWWRSRDKSSAEWMWLGALAGLMAIVRFQDGLLVAITLLDFRRASWRLALMLPGIAVVMLPQLAVDVAQWGTLWPQRAVGQALIPLPGHYLDVLFSSRSGLFVWHPSLLVAAGGLVLLRDRRFAAAALIAFVVETAVNGMLPDWAGGFTFGSRRFIALMPFMAVGFASAAARVRPALAWVGLCALSAWNLLLIANLTYVVVTERDPGYFGLIAGQVRALGYVGRELAQGQVVRDLLLFPVLKQPFRPVSGFAWLMIEAACAVLFVVAVTYRRRSAAKYSTRREATLVGTFRMR